MEFHISRVARERLEVDGLLFSYTGNVVFANVSASRRMASRLNELRRAENDPSRSDPSKMVHGGALFAMGMIDELNHALVARYRKEIDPHVLTEALGWFAAKVGAEHVEKLLLAFVEQFPGVDVYRGKVTPVEWLRGTTEGLPNREAALEELMLLWLTNSNPAFKPFRDLFDDRPLKLGTEYPSVTSALPDYLGTRPPVSPEVGSLLDALRAPMLASPDSLTGQLDFILERWPKYLGGEMPRILLAIDTLREEEIAVWMMFNPPGPDQYRHAAPGWGGEGFEGDEFVGFRDDFRLDPERDFYVDEQGVRHKRYAHDYQAPLNEFEAFSTDQAWMPNVVLMAKSTYVWLEQLSKKYGRHIYHLDHIPEEELKLLADRGITGLWLIGLWERSTASKTIKRLRGQADAVASAYSLKEYNIAEDLGGGFGYAVLRDKAARYGIRLASDMVPNHMGIDSPWVIDHPDWFISRPESPFPVYSFTGPDISPDSRVEIKIEDHYYDQSDAAVVFRLRHHRDGTTRYVFHGNDGTSFAWNDTAQLDYSKQHVREHVIQVILHVARQFPIIRFDAAMVLAKRHVQRLWFPLPGAGGSIPSRAENAISQEQFDALMPNEFWREVVDRVAAEVPGTLLLAEAFWLLEGYFVRTLGMHRVYNSAFMNMLRDEENAKYRSYLKKTIEFDPDILKRYVNFMSNPDEKTAIDQFGSGDKYFGVCTMLSTLPGLPMFGHGQIEGFTERYGMEFKRARMDEDPNEGLVARHQRDIAPLLKARALFAESTYFALYDFVTDRGVDENVFAYSNRMGEERALIFYNNRYESTYGRIHASAESMDKGSGELRRTSLAHALALPAEHSLVMAYRDRVSGLEYLRRSTDFHEHGFALPLRGYQYAVLLDWRVLRSTEEHPWEMLCDALGGRGIANVDEALTRIRLRPLHDALRQAVSAANDQLFAALAGEMDAAVDEAAVAEAEPVIEAEADEAASAPASEAFPDEADVAASELGMASDIELDEGDEGDEEEPVLEPLALRLEEFLESCRVCFARVLESDLSEVQAGIAKQDAAVRYRAANETMSIAVLRLAAEEQEFSAAWPVAGRTMLPAVTGRNWAPTLAWVVLGSMPVPGVRAVLYDKLMLRYALAEIFASQGLEGEDSWRWSARIRILSMLEDGPDGILDSEPFWGDPDVRWLAGVNESGGKTYVNKEQFEELLTWAQLPKLLRAVEGVEAESIEEIEAAVADACADIATAGYELDAYLALRQSGGALSAKTPAGLAAGSSGTA